MTYNPDNIFAKILRAEIPNNTVYENDHVLVFDDITPQAAVHCLIIPKGAYTDQADFSARASDAEIIAFERAIATVVDIKGIGNDGYRAVCNTKENGRQEVPHYHMHILGGEKLPAMITG
ncbi:MAG: histidine triad nucleotide-binding protein [Alphaproteobacteria bacterium]|nr:MAG: histidine triad nucleotide-binding protein [Alphaproteobacteria bacterium]